MKKLLLIAVLLSIGFVVGISWKDLIAHGAGGGGVPVGNGDVNGDGEYDITDAVYYLNWRFLGGPAPVPIECPAPAAKGLPATGQGACYGYVEGQGWVEVPCEEASCKGQDGAYSAGCAMEGRFIDNLDGTVTDTCTGLMWQKETADVNGDGQSTEQDILQWCDALAYCENLSFAGHDDWRLPNVRELQSIVDYGRFYPSIDPVFGALSSGYWSSSTFVDGGGYAWGVDFVVGGVGGGGDDVRGFFRYVRAVRSGP